LHQVGDLFELNVKLRCQKVKRMLILRLTFLRSNYGRSYDSQVTSPTTRRPSTYDQWYHVPQFVEHCIRKSVQSAWAYTKYFLFRAEYPKFRTYSSQLKSKWWLSM